MRTSTVLKRALVLTVLLSIVVSACDTTSTSINTTSTMVMADNEDGHDHDDSDQDRTREWEGSPVPVLSFAVSESDNGGHLVTITADGFVFTGADVFDPVPGEGHAHLFVDGELISMIYGPEFPLPALEAGTHELMVTLSTNDHLEYTVDGEPIGAMSMLTVEEESDPGDDTTETVEVSIVITNGVVDTETERIAVPLGATVVLEIVSDTADEVHVHGYDHFTELRPDMSATLKFVADIPGIFEVELEGSGLVLIELQVG